MITPDQLSAVHTLVSALGPDESTLAALRSDFPGIHFTWCMDDDIAAQIPPAVAAAGFNLYLVDGREHCLCMTTDPSVATGLVVAEVIDDE